jgi:hypothetical protein
VVVTDGAVAFGDLAFPFRRQCFVKRDRVFDKATMAGTVVSFRRHMLDYCVNQSIFVGAELIRTGLKWLFSKN